MERADLVEPDTREAASWTSSGRPPPLGDPHPAVGRRRATLLGLGGARQAIPAVATRVIDSTGAGDVHVGAMLAGVARAAPPAGGGAARQPRRRLRGRSMGGRDRTDRG